MINFIAAVPAVVPFVVPDDPHLALRVSNGVLIAMLFGIGWTWAATRT